MVIDNYEVKKILLCNIVIYLGLVVVFTCLPHLSKSHRIEELIHATNQVSSPFIINQLYYYFIIHINSIMMMKCILAVETCEHEMWLTSELIALTSQTPCF